MNRREFVSKAMTALVVTAHADTLLSSDTRWPLESAAMRARLSSTGTITALEVKTSGVWKAIDFCDAPFAGPSWEGIKLEGIAGSPFEFAAVSNRRRYSLSYQLEGSRLAVTAALKNEGTSSFAPKAASLTLGIHSEMLSYPTWNERYFPTLLRCEKTHFWGYFMTPRGRILTIASPDPVASYSMVYEKSSWGDGGHLIKTTTLDLMHALPLPPRHPQHIASLAPGEERSWKIYLEPVAALEDIKPVLASSLNAPMIDADRYTLARGESSQVTVWAKQDITATVMSEDGNTHPLPLHNETPGRHIAVFTPAGGPGLYKLTVTQASGQQSEAYLSVRQPWTWYLTQARKASLIDKQYASSHLEQWLGLETGVLAHRYLPEPALDQQVDERLREILALQWDLNAKRPVKMPEIRFLVNTAQMASVLTYRYLCDRDPYWLDLASGFADYVVSRQDPDGNYHNYTTVAYPVKCVMTVMMAEKDNPRYAAAYQRHYDSAKKAMDFLVRVKDDLTTEGQNTFEDGMISCAGMQLGLFALLQNDPDKRRVYADAARNMMMAHRCLEQLQIPDSRMHGATLRFWEAQYDVLIGGSRNMMNSPHGWSAWLIPGLWYQYLLTGDEAWLEKTMNAMGSCAQLIDSHSGTLRWGFVPDPYREVTMLVADPTLPGQGKRIPAIIGEQYVPMIASFHYPSKEPVFGNGWDNGWTCCNDVHETFIALSEVVLTSAYMVERNNGELATWNCTAQRDTAGTIRIKPAEDIVTRVHVNLRGKRALEITFSAPVSTQAEGLMWIGPGGIPELFKA
jgi:hypothetical protein